MIKNEEKLFIEALYDEYSLSVKAMAKYILKSEKKADRALFRTFSKIVKHRRLFYGEDRSDTRRLVVIFARGSCFDILRRERGIEYSNDFEVPEDYSPVEKRELGDLLSVLLDKDKFKWFQSTFASFGSPFKEICVLKFYYKIKTSIVSDVLGLNISAVNSILASRLLKLQKLTESYITSRVDPSELGVVVSLASRISSDEDCKALDGYGISRTVIDPGIKKRILKKMSGNKMLVIISLSVAVLIVFIILFFGLR